MGRSEQQVDAEVDSVETVAPPFEPLLDHVAHGSADQCDVEVGVGSSRLRQWLAELNLQPHVRDVDVPGVEPMVHHLDAVCGRSVRQVERCLVLHDELGQSSSEL